jgi:hypothetical protein
MIYQKNGFWKITGNSTKYRSETEAKKAAGIKETVIKESPRFKRTLSPLDRLRGLCVECNCNPCECNKWKLAEET